MTFDSGNQSADGDNSRSGVGVVLPSLPAWLAQCATVHDDGSVALTLSNPVALPVDPSGSMRRGTQLCTQLHFRRLVGAALKVAIAKSERQRKREAGHNFAVAYCLRMAPATFDALRRGAAAADRRAINGVMLWLLRVPVDRER